MAGAFMRMNPNLPSKLMFKYRPRGKRVQGLPSKR